MFSYRFTTRKHLRKAALAALLVTLPGAAQQVEVPRTPAPTQTTDPAYKAFDAQHLKDMPYGGNLPRPAYPSTERVQRAFTVEYVYDYAYSTYQPAVELPTVSPLQAKRDTPEAALIAMFSAMRTGNYEAFVQCFDEAGKAHLAAIAKEQNQGAAFWQGMWKKAIGNKGVLLIDRVETVGYIILNARFNTPTNNAPFPNIFKNVGGQWFATDDLGQRADQMLMSFRPSLAGEIIRVQPVPVAQLVGPAKQQGEAQAEFLKNHDTRSTMIHAAQ